MSAGKSRKLLALVIGCGGLLAAPAGAQAGIVSQGATLTNPGQSATLAPTCPKGQRVTGGGFEAPPPTLGGVTFYESRKLNQRAWQASAWLAAAGVFQVTAYAYCDKDAPKTKTKTKFIALPALTGYAFADASCGRAGKAQAGGFAIPRPGSGGSAYLTESYRIAKRSWRSTAVYAAGSPTLLTQVYCADAGSPKSRTGSASTSVNGAQANAVSGQCTRRTHPGAGGFSVPNPAFGSTSFYSTVIKSFRVGNSWQASAIHSGNTSTTLNALAYCT